MAIEEIRYRIDGNVMFPRESDLPKELEGIRWINNDSCQQDDTGNTFHVFELNAAKVTIIYSTRDPAEVRIHGEPCGREKARQTFEKVIGSRLIAI